MKTETSSFRLDKEVFEDFKKHAKDQGFTTNSMINKIMKEYMQWNSKATSMQMIPSSSTVIMALLKKYDEKQNFQYFVKHNLPLNFNKQVLFDSFNKDQ